MHPAHAFGFSHRRDQLQEEGKLEPFHQGDCRCRTFNGTTGGRPRALGTQCRHRGVVDGKFCKMHANAMEKKGGWHLGFYDEARPETWGQSDVCEYVPAWEKRGNKIRWFMDAEIYATAFTRDVKQIETEGSPEPTAITPAESVEEPAEPTAITPVESVEEPAEPTAITPAESVEEPAEPTAITPAESVEEPAEPAESVEEPAESVEEPAESVEEPAEEPAESVEEPSPPLRHHASEDVTYMAYGP
jgi:hypothetical protein